MIPFLSIVFGRCCAYGFERDMDKNDIFDIATLNNMLIKESPFMVYQRLKELAAAATIDDKNKEELIEQIDPILRIIYFRIEISQLSSNVKSIIASAGKKGNLGPNYWGINEELKKKVKFLSTFIEEYFFANEQVDNFLLKERSNLIIRHPEYGRLIIDAIKRSRKKNNFFWDEAKDFVQILLLRKASDFGSRIGVSEYEVRLKLFQELANFREPEIILMIARKIDNGNSNTSFFLKKLCSSIPVDTPQSAIDWYNKNKDKLIWRGAIVENIMTTSSDGNSVFKTFYVLSD